MWASVDDRSVRTWEFVRNERCVYVLIADAERYARQRWIGHPSRTRVHIVSAYDDRIVLATNNCSTLGHYVSVCTLRLKSSVTRARLV